MRHPTLGGDVSRGRERRHNTMRAWMAGGCKAARRREALQVLCGGAAQTQEREKGLEKIGRERAEESGRRGPLQGSGDEAQGERRVDDDAEMPPSGLPARRQQERLRCRRGWHVPSGLGGRRAADLGGDISLLQIDNDLADHVEGLWEGELLGISEVWVTTELEKEALRRVSLAAATAFNATMARASPPPVAAPRWLLGASVAR
ncbi:unnamed protein product [Prorocentrum cordatum]|uniref:Uncharacterized protein n=1 Tax=Prorocentrum cordatum TaxID=2364126 RepID=A0ABN9TIU6_9DINO|nr:unnamed protein product [Polarella glacialis]